MRATVRLPRTAVLALLGSLCAGCGAAPPKQADPASVSSPDPAGATSEAAPPKQAPSDEGAEPASPAKAESTQAAVKVSFPPGASVDAAIKAVPQGMPRMNMADDALQRPLMNVKQYEECKVPRSARVSISVAVYDGAAVGVDVSTKPKNAKMEACLDQVVRRLSWDKVPSLNTVTFNF